MTCPANRGATRYASLSNPAAAERSAPGGGVGINEMITVLLWLAVPVIIVMLAAFALDRVLKRMDDEVGR